MRDGPPERPTVLVVCDDRRRTEEVRADLLETCTVLVRTPDANGAAPPEVTLVVTDLPSDTDGADRVVHLRQQHRCPVVVVVDVADQPRVVPPLAAGARGLVVAGAPPGTIAEAVHTALGGGLYVDPSAADILVDLARINAHAESVPELTPAQLRVLSRFPRGLSNPEIAAELGISVNTVKTHVRHILAALGCDNRVEAMRVAQRRGLLQ